MFIPDAYLNTMPGLEQWLDAGTLRMDTTFKMAGLRNSESPRALYKFVDGVKPKQVPVFRSRKINYGDRARTE